MTGEANRAGFVTVIGRPNVGKSTLINHLMGMKLAITSSKPQTTRRRMRTVYTCDRGQIVFLDTPGLHKAKNELGYYMDRAAQKTIEDVDVVLWLVEPDTRMGEAEKRIRDILIEKKARVILAVNKTDTVKKALIEPVLTAYRNFMDFEAVLPISAKHSLGFDVLLDKIFSLLPEGDNLYDEETVTDETLRSIVGELIREQALRNLSEEVPHGVAVTIDNMKEGEDIWHIDATIFCEKKSHKGIIIGKGGSMLKRIGTGARLEAEKLLESRVMLSLFVKVRQDWRDNEKAMRSFGYDKKEV